VTRPREGGTSASAGAGELDSFVDGGSQGWWVGALDSLDDGAGAQDQESGHGAHAVLLGDLALAVDIHLDEGDLVGFGVLGREGFKRWRNHLAGAAPVGVD